jgi:hypothetical protein
MGASAVYQDVGGLSHLGNPINFRRFTPPKQIYCIATFKRRSYDFGTKQRLLDLIAVT